MQKNYKFGGVSEEAFRAYFDDVTSAVGVVKQFEYKCTKKRSKKYPQFRWVALEEL